MKKFGAFLFVSTLFLTGCGKDNKVTCSMTIEEDGVKITSEVIATLKDDKVDNATAKMSFSDEKAAKEYCDIFALASSFSTDDSTKLDYNCDGKNITINNYEALVAEDGKISGLTKQEFIDKMKKTASDDKMEITCK